MLCLKDHKLKYSEFFNIYAFLRAISKRVSDSKGGTKTEGVWEQGVEENIWTKEGWSDGRVEKAA
jgi:hypothetical protein